MLNRYTNLALIGIITCSLIYLCRVATRYSDHNVYALVFEESTSGIMVGSSVTIRGVKVGVVRKIELHDTELNKVKVLIKTTPLNNPELLEARLVLASFIGQHEVDLSYLKLGYVLPKIDGHMQIRVSPSLKKKVNDALEGLVHENNLAAAQELSQTFITRVSDILNCIKQITQKATFFLNDCTNISDSVMNSLAQLEITKRKLDLVLEAGNQILTNTELQEFLRTGFPTIIDAFKDTRKLANNASHVVAEFNRSPLTFLFKPQRTVELKIRKRS